MIEKYIHICDLLDCLGAFPPRLDIVQQMIKQPDFCYIPYESPEILTDTFLASSYWLDKELFDETYLYKRNTENLSPMQKTHLKMVDIGVDLLEKGFPLKYNPDKFVAQGPRQLSEYVKTFAEQCRKRRAFLRTQKTRHVPLVQRLKEKE